MFEYLKQAFTLFFTGDDYLWSTIITTAQMTTVSTLVSAVIGLPIGTALGKNSFRGKGVLMRFINTLMGLPPVVAGLVVFLLFCRVGPLGSFHIIYSIKAMIVAQVLLITPIVIGLSANCASAKAASFNETCHGLGLSKGKQIILLLIDCRAQLVSVVLTGFGRAIAEVGAVSIVGGNIQNKTRVMTTAIQLETGKGNFEFAVAIGILLLTLSFVVNSLAYSLQEKMK